MTGLDDARDSARSFLILVIIILTSRNLRIRNHAPIPLLLDPDHLFLPLLLDGHTVHIHRIVIIILFVIITSNRKSTLP